VPQASEVVPVLAVVGVATMLVADELNDIVPGAKVFLAIAPLEVVVPEEQP
jgi:hypothetical protein